jgi:uncharacterized membrane protein
MEIRNDRNRNSGAYVGATLLIVLGLSALVANLWGSKYGYESIPLAIGVAFLVAYALTHQYGFLVPGGILSGVGAGLLASSLINASDAGPYVVIGGGVGFLLIFCIDMLVSRAAMRWWPVIPGGLMVLIGTGTAGENQDVLRQFEVWSPVVLIAIGVLILFARLRQPSR